MDQRQLEFEARVYQMFFRESNIGFWHAYFPQPLDTKLHEDEQIERLFAEPLLDFCNDSYATMNDYSSSHELLGMLPFLFAVREEKLVEAISHFIQAGYRVNDIETCDVEKAGNPRWCSNKVVGDLTDGMLIGIWGMQRVITNRKALQAKRAELRHLLSLRQYLLLQLLTDGYDLKEAAEAMNIAGNTAHIHLARIMNKLDIHSRDLLVKTIRELGIGRAGVEDLPHGSG